MDTTTREGTPAAAREPLWMDYVSRQAREWLRFSQGRLRGLSKRGRGMSGTPLFNPLPRDSILDKWRLMDRWIANLLVIFLKCPAAIEIVPGASTPPPPG